MGRGALLGSVLTSGVAFATLVSHPSAVFQLFGLTVVLALTLSVLVSVLVLPSFPAVVGALAAWHRQPRPTHHFLGPDPDPQLSTHRDLKQ